MRFDILITNDGADYVAVATAPNGHQLTAKAKTPREAELAIADSCKGYADTDAGYTNIYALEVPMKAPPQPGPAPGP